MSQPRHKTEEKEMDLPQFTLFFDRRSWSSGKLTIDADSADEAWRLYQSGVLDDYMAEIKWDCPDDVQIALVDVQARLIKPETRIREGK